MRSKITSPEDSSYSFFQRTDYGYHTLQVISSLYLSTCLQRSPCMKGRNGSMNFSLISEQRENVSFG